MADVKISALPAATTPLAGTEVLPIVQSGVTTKVAVSNLTAGRAVTLGTGSILGTPASGILTSCTGLNYDGFKNRIINGAMVIDQRNAGASVTPSVDTYLLDRWIVQYSQSSKFTWQQNKGSVTLPAGFSNYLGSSVASAYSVLTADYFALNQGIEGFNVSDLSWGTANAKTVTLSFLVYSSLTGTFGGAVKNLLSGATRSYPFSYSVSVANTWTTISITIAGDTSGTWATNNGAGLCVTFGLGVGATYSGTAGSWAGTNYLSATGAVSVVGTASATFYITGVQLEKGSTATSFDYRSYGTELALCQRYYYQYTGNASSQTPIAAAFLASTVSAQGLLQFPVPMRAAPTQSGSAAADTEVTWSAGTSSTSALTLDLVSTLNASLRITTTGLTTGQGGYFRLSVGATKHLAFSSEL